MLPIFAKIIEEGRLVPVVMKDKTTHWMSEELLAKLIEHPKVVEKYEEGEMTSKWIV